MFSREAGISYRAFLSDSNIKLDFIEVLHVPVPVVDQNFYVYCLHNWPQQPFGQDLQADQTKLDLHS
jgi:hypothetical protein